MSHNQIEVKVTKEELINILSQVEKSTFINMVTYTNVRMNKTGNPYFEQIKKLTKRNYLIGNDYENRVLNNGEKEGISQEENTFEVEEMKGKVHLSKCVLKDTKTGDKRYLMVELFDEVKPQVEYLWNNQTIEFDTFKDFLVKVSESKKQPQEKKVKVNTPLIDNIKELSMNGYKYIIE
jgi:hypothetical protein